MASSSNKNVSLHDKLNSLRKMMQQLQSKADVIQHEVRNEELQASKRRKSEVSLWLEQVTNIENQVQSINEEEVDQVGLSVRGKLWEKCEDLIYSVKKLLKQGEFPRGLLLDDYKPEGLRLATEKLEGSTPSMVEDLVWDCFKSGERRVGIYGMGGVGKTSLAMHINNKIMKKQVWDLFNHVYYVTVSRDTSVFGLQCDIATAIGCNLGFYRDEQKAAGELSKTLSNREGSLLILDDVWEDISKEMVGVSVDRGGCKLLITTRKSDVCCNMKCFPIEMGPLSDKESWDLFKKQLGNDFEQLSDEAKHAARSVAEECDGLPLGIVTMAGSMRGETSEHVWRDALTTLQNPCTIQNDMETKLYSILRFIYGRLKDEKHRKCFLYCALYPEDYEIEKDELISQYTALGLLDGSNRQAKIDKGHTLLNSLVSASLLECGRTDKVVKMHHLVRDMANIIIGSTGMVKAGKDLEEIPGEMEWMNKDLEWVSLMRYNMEDIEGTICTDWPKVSALLLLNTYLHSKPNSFFARMIGLKVLNLSRASISVLPDSVCGLEYLNSLLLSNCECLHFIPSMAKLTKLKEFVLEGCSKMTKLPEGMEELVNLEHLNLKSTGIKDVDEGLFRKLYNLESLLINSDMTEPPPNELMSLTHLERFIGGHTSDARWFNECVGLGCFNQWRFYFITVGSFPNEGDRLHFNRGICVDSYWSPEMLKELLVPNNVQRLQFRHCSFGFRSLVEVVPSLSYATELECFELSGCVGIGYIVSDGGSNPNPLEGIQQLHLYSLNDFVGLITEEVANPYTISFGGLRKLEIANCPKLKKLWMLNLDLPNLEEIHVCFCKQMEEIFATENGAKIELPKLHSLYLDGLSELRSIWGSNIVLCPQLVKLEVRDCPMVRKLGLLSHNLPSLEEIKISICKQIEEIFAVEDEGGDDAIQLPNLKKLELSILPELRSICQKTIVCNSLQRLSLDCSTGDKMNNCPISVSSLSSLNPLPVLEAWDRHGYWWHSLYWNDPVTEAVFQEYGCLTINRKS